MILMDDGLAFTNEIVAFPPRLRKLWLKTGGFALPPNFYEHLNHVDALEELKCDFEMSEPFLPPGALLSSKLTGFRASSTFVNRFLDLPGIRLENITDLRIVFAHGAFYPTESFRIQAKKSNLRPSVR